MRFIRLLILIIILLGTFYYIYDTNEINNNDTNRVKEQQKITRQPKKRDLKSPSSELEGDVYGWIEEEPVELEEAYGKPVRKDKSKYGYEWWIYNDLEGEYVQFGVKDNSIQTIYITGDNASLDPLSIKEDYSEVHEDFTFENEITFEKDGHHYTFHLNEDDLEYQPLIRINDELFIQAYMDTFTDTLIAVRILSADILLAVRPYDLTYEGSLSGEEEWSEEDWEDIQKAMELQVFDVTNVFRKQFEESTLEWYDPLHDTALSHSKDMKERDYFSHVSPDGDGLSERLQEQDVNYQSAGENIAADYIDGPAAVVGWLNSEGHRKIMLDDSFTKLGVGVYRNYFTQNYTK